jgi:hypothetical protein
MVPEGVASKNQETVFSYVLPLESLDATLSVARAHNTYFQAVLEASRPFSRRPRMIVSEKSAMPQSVW